MIPYTLIRSSRHTLSIQISRTWELIARAPERLSISRVESFIVSKRDWIEKHMQWADDRKQKAKRKKYGETEIQEMKERLAGYIIPRVRELWEWKNLPKYTSIKITKSEWRWWSCSAKNGLCFSYRLAEYLNPPVKGGCPIGQGGFISGNKTPLNSLLTGGCETTFIDAIIIHELAHLREKNHQKPFWNLVYHMMPEYEMIIKEGKSIWYSVE